MAAMDQKDEAKRALRRRMKERRDQLTAGEASAKSQEICRHILNWEPYRRAGSILAYFPLGNEVDLRPVLRHALAAKKTVGLPRVLGERTMDFYGIQSFNDLVPGPMKLMEPAGHCPRLPRPSCLVLMLVPGLAFCGPGSGQGGAVSGFGRMGYGGGFYDTWLERYEKRGAAACGRDRLITCGVAYAFQIVEPSELPLERHDRLLDHIVTENGGLAIP